MKHILIVFCFKVVACLTVFCFVFFTDSTTQGAAGDTFGRSQGQKKKPKFVQKSPLGLALMLSFWSSQFGDAAQRVWGSASNWSDQFGRFLPGQRRSDFSPLLVYNILMWFLSSQIETLCFRLSHGCQLQPQDPLRDTLGSLRRPMFQSAVCLPNPSHQRRGASPCNGGRVRWHDEGTNSDLWKLAFITTIRAVLDNSCRIFIYSPIKPAPPVWMGKFVPHPRHPIRTILASKPHPSSLQNRASGELTVFKLSWATTHLFREVQQQVNLQCVCVCYLRALYSQSWIVCGIWWPHLHLQVQLCRQPCPPPSPRTSRRWLDREELLLSPLCKSTSSKTWFMKLWRNSGSSHPDSLINTAVRGAWSWRCLCLLFRDTCHRDIVNLQVEMVRQFYIQLVKL